ncbi:ribosome biogenesis GTPase [Thalassobacillus cyri]|uniref:Small ribosomal subunit biogenesis GTPase RsgA n=1 Tax=Thalassobacillus cyri TaxID=571932 RepID=A0A1H4FSK5_9BACI|nr:ribosome small subunit-dependent GTPase A [Thalassobacillus cyri]SEB00141.1 ribosome biogenesis GTPase [Thalassobacillus cyri]
MEKITWETLGYESFFQTQTIGKETPVGRITKAGKGFYTIQTPEKAFSGQLSGKYRFEAEVQGDYPCVGDWVLFQPQVGEDKAVIHQRLERRTLLTRHAAGNTYQEQVMAANIDDVWIVSSMDQDFNLRRIERYLMQVYESGAVPIIVLTKADLASDPDRQTAEVEQIAPGVSVYPVDTLQGVGFDSLIEKFTPGMTIALIGSSGVGKSSLINRLVGKTVQKTQEVRAEDHKGKHTTTHREMFLVPGGPLILDTPGMRELQLWGEADGVHSTFYDIEAYSSQCKFRDCSHGSEPGCTVQQAIKDGRLTEERLKNYWKMQREIERLDLKAKYGTHKANRILHRPNSKK